MKIGIGLPNTLLHTTGEEMLAWATRADEPGFSTLATIDRIVYPSYDSLISLAAAAGATSRIGLLTNVLLGPLYEPYLLAKQSASLDQLSGGRFTLGLGVGSRGDDYSAMHKELSDRGKRFDDELDLLHRAWRVSRSSRVSTANRTRPVPCRRTARSRCSSAASRGTSRPGQ